MYKLEPGEVNKLTVPCYFPHIDSWRGDRHSPDRADGLGRSHRPVLQPVGQDPDAAALPAGLQARATEGAGHGGLQCQRMQRTALAPGEFRRGCPNPNPSPNPDFGRGGGDDGCAGF